MRMRTWMVAVWVAATAAAGAQGIRMDANAPGHIYHGWGIYGAYWDASEAGSTGGAGLRISVEMVPGVNLELRGTAFGRVSVGDERFRVTPYDGGLSLLVPVSERANFVAGGGLTYADVSGAGADSETGFYGSLGMDMSLRPQARLFADLIYRFLEVDTSTRTVDLDGIGVQAGVLITW